MTTGKVKRSAAELAVEIDKRLRPELYPDMTERFQQLERRHELQRLRSEVVERAKIMYQDFNWTTEDKSDDAINGLMEAVDALVGFESGDKK